MQISLCSGGRRICDLYRYKCKRCSEDRLTYVVKEDTVTEQLSRKAAPYHLQKRMLADGSYEELPQREYVEEEGLPRQDKYAIGLPCLIQEDKKE